MEVVIEIVKSRAKKLYTPAGMRNRIQYHVRVKAPNGKVLLVSETYTRRRAALNCAASFTSSDAVKVYDMDETGAPGSTAGPSARRRVYSCW